MTVRVLVVDDSGFYRRRLTEILNADPQIEVIGSAVDGRDAFKKVVALQPDVVTMDVEMPVMDGIQATQRIMSTRPTPILMFSSLTHEGAQATLDALEAGAVDFLPKRFEDISNNQQFALTQLRLRVKAVAAKKVAKVRVPVSSAPQVKPPIKNAPINKGQTPEFKAKEYSLVAIGTSTGGPLALQQIVKTLPKDFPVPILLIQHMPANFTDAFAHRLDGLSNIHVKEAASGDILEPGVALVAPGGKQMEVEKLGGRVRVSIKESPVQQHYRPCIDTTLESIAYSVRGKVLVIILTGMGADGREGARRLKRAGANVWAQDEASSVIYGMPAAVAQAGLADQVLSLQEIADALVKGCCA